MHAHIDEDDVIDDGDQPFLGVYLQQVRRRHVSALQR